MCLLADGINVTLCSPFIPSSYSSWPFPSLLCAGSHVIPHALHPSLFSRCLGNNSSVVSLLFHVCRGFPAGPAQTACRLCVCHESWCSNHCVHGPEHPFHFLIKLYKSVCCTQIGGRPALTHLNVFQRDIFVGGWQFCQLEVVCKMCIWVHACLICVFCTCVCTVNMLFVLPTLANE